MTSQSLALHQRGELATGEEVAPRPIFLHIQLLPTPSIDYLSRGVEALTGHDRSAVTRDPRRLLRLVPPADRRRLVAYLRDPNRGRDRIELHIRQADGSMGPIEAWLAPQLNAEAVPVEIDIVVRRINHSG